MPDQGVALGGGTVVRVGGGIVVNVGGGAVVSVGGETVVSVGGGTVVSVGGGTVVRVGGGTVVNVGGGTVVRVGATVVAVGMPDTVADGPGRGVSVTVFVNVIEGIRVMVCVGGEQIFATCVNVSGNSSSAPPNCNANSYCCWASHQRRSAASSAP